MADDCSWWQMTCHVQSGISTAIDETTGMVVKVWMDAVMEACDSMISKLGSLWLQVPTPTLSGGNSVVPWVHTVTGVFTTAIAVGSLIVAGIQVMTAHRGEDVRRIAYGLLLMAGASGAAVAAAQVGVQIGEAFSTWVIGQATSGKGTFTEKIFDIGILGGSPTGMPMLLILILCLVALLANLVQVILLLVRSAMLILLVGMLPMAAAAAVTGWGQNWLRKMVVWTVAFICYKPVASLIYAIGIKLMSTTKGDDVLYSTLLGMVLMVAAVLALPALVGFMMPAAAAMGGGGMSAGAMAAGGMSVANGAQMVSRSVGGSASASPSGADSAPATGASAGVPAQGPAGPSGPAGGNGASGGSGPAGAQGPASSGSPVGATGTSNATAGVGGSGAAASGAGSAGGAASGAAAVAAPVAGAAVVGAQAASAVGNQVAGAAQQSTGGGEGGAL